MRSASALRPPGGADDAWRLDLTLDLSGLFSGHLFPCSDLHKDKFCLIVLRFGSISSEFGHGSAAAEGQFEGVFHLAAADGIWPGTEGFNSRRTRDSCGVNVNECLISSDHDPVNHSRDLHFPSVLLKQQNGSWINGHFLSEANILGLQHLMEIIVDAFDYRLIASARGKHPHLKTCNTLWGSDSKGLRFCVSLLSLLI